MSGVAILYYQASHNTALTNQVPAARIFSGVIPLETTLPAISITQVDGNTRNIVKNDGVNVLWTDRVQVTVAGKSYRSVKDILSLVQAACGNVRGTINGIKCDSIVDDSVGPDIFEQEDGIFEQSQDFIVKYVK